MGVTSDALAYSKDDGKSWQASDPVPAPSTIAQSPLVPTRTWSLDPIAWHPARIPNPEPTRALQSLDGGLSWTASAAASGRLLFDGANADAALVGFEANLPRRTDDAGQSWTRIAQPGQFLAVASCSAPWSCQYAITQVGLSTANPCHLSKTEDLGQSWGEPLTVPSELCYGTPALVVATDEPQHLLAACGPAVCVSHDGGRSFDRYAIGDDPMRYVGTILSLSGGVVLAATWGIAEPAAAGHAVVARSDDGGINWTQVLDAGGGTLLGSTAHPETAFLLEPVSNRPHALYRTDDAGLSWRRIAPSVATRPGMVLDFFGIADAADGGFLAATTHGLAHFH
jgi:photosystem II stability/assembly factor-like uncharacterized protein